jgi:limonene-1,2-epoxide hydrolase
MLDPSNSNRVRRAAVVAIVILSAILAIGCASTPTADGPAPAQQANIQVVNDFIAAWSDPDEAVAYLAPQASVRMMEDQPPIVGQAAIAAAFKSFMAPGVSLSVETLSTTAHGPVVMNKRIDVLKTEGKPDQVFPVVGVFLVKNGKIVEWTDYLEK